MDGVSDCPESLATPAARNDLVEHGAAVIGITDGNFGTGAHDGAEASGTK